jgi:hypothetical protein
LVQADISVGNPPLLNVIGIGLQTKSISQWMRSGRAAEREWHRLCVDLSELLMSSSYARSEPLEIPNCPGAAANIALALTTFRTAQAQRDAVYNRYRAASSNEVLNNLTAGRVQSIPDNPWTRLQLGAMAMAFADSGCGLTEEELTKAHVSADVFSVVAITRFVTSDNPVNAVSLRAQPEYALILGRVAAQTQKCKDPSVRSFMTNLVVTLGRLS